MASKILLQSYRSSISLFRPYLSIFQPKYFSTEKPSDLEIHTGAKWDKNDYRMARFVNKPKHVNPNYAIKLIDEIPPQEEKDKIVFCDGGGGPLGHPKVFINLDKPGNHICGYCGLRFYKKDAH